MENDKRNDESCGNIDDQTDSTKNAIKRSLNDSDESIKLQSNKSRKNEHNQEYNHKKSNIPSISNSNYVMQQNSYKFPVEHIQRAVTHNLPCFTIKFEKQDQLPSAVAAANSLYDHFESQKIRLMNGFSVVRYMGSLLKVGVKNKDDYHKLCDAKIWPTVIRGQTVLVMMPKIYT